MSSSRFVAPSTPLQWATFLAIFALASPVWYALMSWGLYCWVDVRANAGGVALMVSAQLSVLIALEIDRAARRRLEAWTARRG